MVKIILYTQDNIEIEPLKNFKYNKFELISYGILNDNYSYIYGDYKINTTKHLPGPKIFNNQEAIKYIGENLIVRMEFLELDKFFGNFIKAKKTDLEIEDMCNSEFIKFLSEIIEKGKIEKKKFYSNECSAIYIL